MLHQSFFLLPAAIAVGALVVLLAGGVMVGLSSLVLRAVHAFAPAKSESTVEALVQPADVLEALVSRGFLKSRVAVAKR